MSVVNSLHIIPDNENIDSSLEICEEYGTYFEYNDFFSPTLLDDEAALKERISFYKALNRPKGKDTLHGVFFDICVNSSDAIIADISRKRMLSSMEIAETLDCKGVIFHTNLIPGFEPDFYLNNWLDSYGEFYKELSERFAGIDIYVENMFDYKPDMLAKLMERTVSETIGVCFDVAHSHLHKDVTMLNWIDTLAPFIKHLHINDNDGRIDGHMSVGSGTINWKEYFDFLNQKIPNQVSLLVEVTGTQKQQESLEYLREHGYI